MGHYTLENYALKNQYLKAVGLPRLCKGPEIQHLKVSVTEQQTYGPTGIGVREMLSTHYLYNVQYASKNGKVDEEGCELRLRRLF